jgi:hypothetical protein
VVGMNPITAKNNTIVTLHHDDKECGSKRFSPYIELHGDNTSSLHRVPPPHVVKRQVGLHELAILPSKLLEDRVRHQIDEHPRDWLPVDEHPRDWLPVDVTPNIQRLQVLA